MVRNKASLLGGLTVLLLMGIGGGMAQTVNKNTTATNSDGYDYELWFDNRGNQGTGSMTLKGGGAYTCNWQNAENFLARTGKKWLDTSKTHSQIGEMKIEYNCQYNPQGNSYLCVYGWTVSPLVEYYIIESWGTWEPPDGGNGGSKAEISVDGGTYKMKTAMRNNQPSIFGTSTFQQFFNVRKGKRTSGTISVSEHFKAWEKQGLKMGKMYEVALCTEGYQSSGSNNVTNFVLSINGVPLGKTPILNNNINVQKNNGLVIYRSEEALNISGNTLLNQDMSKISIINPMGKVFQLQNVVQNGSSLTLPTSNLPSGSYILRNGNKAVHQFVVNR